MVDDIARALWQAGSMAICKSCGFTYDRRSIHGRALHRRAHEVWKIDNLKLPNYTLQGDVLVNQQSPARLHKLVYNQATALSLEQDYDFPPWPKKGPDDPKSHAWLFVEDQKPVGAAGISWQRWSNAPPNWHLVFVRVAVDWRRREVLAKRWPTFVHEYDGKLTLERPLSDSMRAFLDKVDWVGIAPELRAAGISRKRTNL